MNKRFSTLVAAFAAIATVSYAQIGGKYVHLKTSSNYLTWDKASLADSVALGSKGTTKADMDSALWKANLVRVNMPGNDSIYTLTQINSVRLLLLVLANLKLNMVRVVIVLSVQLLMASWLRCLKLPAC